MPLVYCVVMKTVDWSHGLVDLSSALYRLAQEGEANEPFRLLLDTHQNYRYWMGRDTFKGYPVVFNEYEGGYYLGDEQLPYRFLIQAKDQEVTVIKVHPTCVLICTNAFRGHPNLKEIFIENQEPLQIGNDAFAECPSLSRVSFDAKDKVTLRSGAFRDNPTLSEVRFDDTAPYEFSSRAFANCSSLTTFEFPLGIAIDATQNRAYEVFKGTPISHIYLPKAIYYVERWFEKSTTVYCEIDPKEVRTDYKEETIIEPYYDYYHPGGTSTIRTSIVGGENFLGPISKEDYQNRFAKN